MPCVGNSTAAQCINSTCGPDVIDFMTEVAGRMKFDHWLDFGHVWPKNTSPCVSELGFISGGQASLVLAWLNPAEHVQFSPTPSKNFEVVVCACRPAGTPTTIDSKLLLWPLDSFVIQKSEFLIRSGSVEK